MATGVGSGANSWTDLLRIMSKASPSYKAAMLEEEVLTDRYSLHTLEYLLSKERRHLLETKEPLQHELLLNRPALFWKDVYQELQHLQPQAQVLLAHIRQFLDTWESIHFWSGEPLDQRYWDAGFVHEAMGRPAVLTVKPYDQETPSSFSEESEEEEVLDINTPVTIPVDYGLESKYARLLKDPLTISPEEWKEMGKYMAATEPSPADPWILEEAEESVGSSAAVDNSNGSLPELSTGATFMTRAVEYEEEAADSPHSAGPAADFDEDETEGFDEWISSLDAQINEDSLPGEEGEGLDDSDDSLVFLEERFEEDNVWLEEHLDVDESVKDAHFNVGPCIKYLTEEHVKAMKGATDPWSNPVLLSYLRFDRLPINISRTQRHLLLKRSRAFEWRTHTSDPGEHLIILRKGHPARLYPFPAYRRELLYKAHEEGHQQSFGMIRRLVKDYSWYRLREEAMEYVRRCHTCQDSSTMVTADREMHAIPVLDKGERWHLDLIGPLVEGIEGFKYAAVAIDSCTKWPEVAPLRTKRAEEVESFVFREIVCRFNVKEIVVDNGSEFLGDFEKMASDLGIKLVHTSVYHPQAEVQSDAQAGSPETIQRPSRVLASSHSSGAEKLPSYPTDEYRNGTFQVSVRDGSASARNGGFGLDAVCRPRDVTHCPASRRRVGWTVGREVILPPTVSLAEIVPRQGGVLDADGHGPRAFKDTIQRWGLRDPGSGQCVTLVEDVAWPHMDRVPQHHRASGHAESGPRPV